MGLINTYTDANKVTDQLLRVQYAVVPDKCSYTGWVEQESPSGATYEVWTTYDKMYYRVFRYATKSYSYVGMDETTAKACLNAKVSQYTRGYSRVVEVDVPDSSSSNLIGGSGESQSEGEGHTHTELRNETTRECRSDIVAQHVDGHMWQVIINVNEEDEKYSYTLPANPASMFTAENQRNYDE